MPNPSLSQQRHLTTTLRRTLLVLAALYLLAAIGLSIHYQWLFTYQILGSGFVLAVAWNWGPHSKATAR